MPKTKIVLIRYDGCTKYMALNVALGMYYRFRNNLNACWALPGEIAVEDLLMTAEEIQDTFHGSDYNQKLFDLEWLPYGEKTE